jgi:hypothetical protein
MTQQPITRPGIALNPLDSYQPQTVFQNDKMVTHGNLGYVGGDTQTVEYDFGLKVANSVAECPMKLYSGLIDPANPPAPVESYKNELVYNPTTWLEWTKSAGVVADSTGIEWTANGTTSVSATLTTNLKPSTNYGFLYNVVSNTLTGNFGTSSSFSFGVLPKTIGYNKYIRSSAATLSPNNVILYIQVSAEPVGNKIKLKDIRIFELPPNSGIEWNFNNLTADQLNALYPFNSTGVTQTNNGLWKEVTSQAVIDRIKNQNELNITSVDTTGRTAIVNGQTLVQQGINNPAVRDDFANKTAGNTVGNPNVAKSASKSTLLNPADSGWYDWDSNNDQVSYDVIKTQNGSCRAVTANIVGQQPQTLISMNVIREIEDKYGLIPVDRTGTAAEVLARQVQWCKDNLSRAQMNAYVYGVCPTGNKANVAIFFNGAWSGTISNTSSSPTNTIKTNTAGATWNDFSYAIQPDGFINYISYTDPARTTDTTLLVLTGHGLSNGDIIQNITRNSSGLLVSSPTVNAIVTPTIVGQQSGDTIKKYKFSIAKPSETGTTSTTVIITNHGLSTGDFVKNLSRSSIRLQITVVDANTFTVPNVDGQTVGDGFGLYPLYGTQTAESTVIPSTIYTDYVSLDLQLKASAGYDVLVPSNPRRDAGLGYAVQLQKVYGKQTSDYTGKVAGSVAENPNKAYFSKASGLQIPSNITGNDGTGFRESTNYSPLYSQNGVNYSEGKGELSGQQGQNLFSFDLIAKFEKDNGTIPITLTGNADTDKANKIAWLKSANGISKLTAKWYGYGSCPSGNKAYLDMFYNGFWYYKNNNISNDKSNASNTPTLISMSASTQLIIANLLQPDGFAHFLAYTDASDGVTASTIYTDYISLDIEYNAPNNSVEYFTNNSVELESLTNAKAQAYMVETDLSALCNSLAGGSNSAFKALLKSITADVCAMGSGANANVLGYGIKTQPWYTGAGGSWSASVFSTNVTNTIAKMSFNTASNIFIDANNKVYAIVYSQYNSDGTIPSQVSLDYIKLTVALTRQPDVVAPISVNLPKNWAMLVKGFSPSWDNTNTSAKYIVELFKDSNNRYALIKETNNKLYLYKFVGGIATAIYPIAANFIIKYQVQNILFLQTSSGLVVYALPNNGTMIKISNTDKLALSGVLNLNILVRSTHLQQADAFADTFKLIDLTAMGKPTGFTDAEALAMLNGTAKGYENPNLVDMSKITLHSNATYDKATNTITLNAPSNSITGTLYLRKRWRISV